MAQQRNAFKLGVTVIVMLVLLVGILLFLADIGQALVPMRAIAVAFPEGHTVQGLKSDSPVLMGDMVVGHVTDVRLEQRGDGPAKALYTVVEAEIPEQYALYTDCHILLEAPPLGGSAKLVIESIGTSGTEVADGAEIAGDAPAGFAAVLDQLSGMFAMLEGQLDPTDPGSLVGKISNRLLVSLTDVNAITASLRHELTPEQQRTLLGKLHATLDHINAVTGELKRQADPGSGQMIAKVDRALDALNAGLDDAVGILRENRPVVQSTVQHVAHLAETVDTRIAENVAQQTDPALPGSLMSKVHQATDSTNQALTDVTEITQATRQILLLNRPNIEGTLENFKEASDHIKGAAKDLWRNPWRLFYRPDLEQTRQLNIFDASRAFAEAATELDDATARLSALAEMHQQAIPADDPQLQALREQLKETFARFDQAEAALWDALGER